jgi:hypothetical protein
VAVFAPGLKVERRFDCDVDGDVLLFEAMAPVVRPARAETEARRPLYPLGGTC